ncbi:hypothetical protein Dimus_027108 [Dionaea muscipula]
MASKSKSKPKAKPRSKKDVVSPAVGENEVEEDEEAQSDKAVEDKTQTVEASVLVVGEELQVRKRRRLRKVASTQLAEAGDNEDTQSDEDVPERPAADLDVNKEGQTRKRRQKQVARIGPAAKRTMTDKGKVSLVEVGTEPCKESVVSGSPTIEELDQQVDELLAHLFVSEVLHEEIDKDDIDQQGQRDGQEVLEVGEKEEGEEKGEQNVGPSTFERRYRRRSLFPPKRLSVPSGHMVRSCVDSLMGTANHATIRAVRDIPLKHKCAILCRNMTKTSLLTGDVLYNVVRTDDRRCRKIDRLMEEKYALEREVKELRFECDFAIKISTQMKAAVDMVMEENQTLENKNEELKTALEGEKGKVKTLEDKVKELQTALEKEKKEKTKKQDELMELNPKVKYEKEHIPLIEGEPSVWSEAYEEDPMKFFKEWGIEADVSMDIPCPVKVVHQTPPFIASQAPSTSALDVPPQDPTPHPSPLSE